MKHSLQRTLLLLVVGIEAATFVWVYRYSGQGSLALQQLQHETDSVQTELTVLNKEIRDLEHEVNTWKSHTFYKEKIAREQLQMARAGDTIYYVS